VRIAYSEVSPFHTGRVEANERTSDHLLNHQTASLGLKIVFYVTKNAKKWSFTKVRLATIGIFVM